MLSFIRYPVALAAIAALLLPFASPLGARADGDDAAGDAGIGVARINVISGSVSVQRGDTATPFDAAVNAPVLGADYVTTGDASRAEIQFDGTSSVRLGENAQLRFVHLDTGSRELQLAQGTIEMRLLRGAGSSVVDTPSVSVRALEAGAYRFTVDAAGRTQITVRSGRAAVALPQGEQTLVPGTTLLASGAANAPVTQTVAAIGLDTFDTFNGERDQRESLALTGPAYVAPSVQGVDDLYAYGRWVDDGSYGTVWVPTTVATGWAPYRDGRWVWEDNYGWTWVGYEPWGWAPYHYGRWYHSAAYGWAWYPPRPAVVEVWRPALVAFIGFGGGGGFGFGFGNIGWVALAPFEPYHPWWGRGYGTTVVNNTYVTNNYYGNVNNGNITRIYKNAQYNGVTSVSQQRFLQGRFDHPVAVTPTQLRSVQVARGPLPVVPTRANLRFSEHAATAMAATHPVIVQRAFAGDAHTVVRTPFEQQRTAIRTFAHEPATAAHGPATAAAENNALHGPGAVHPITTTTTTGTTGTPAAPSVRAMPVDTAPRAVRTTDPWSRFNNAHGTTVSSPQSTELHRVSPPAVTQRSTVHENATTTTTITAPAHANAVVHPAPVREITTRHETAPARVEHPHVARTPAPAAHPDHEKKHDKP